MQYLSQILNKPIYFKGQPFAKLVDMSVSGKESEPSVHSLVVKQGKNKYLVPATNVSFENNRFVMQEKELLEMAREDKAILLSEDLLDKQVIDINGRRLVRVNDILLDDKGKLQVTGIDVGLAGILRRLGLSGIRVKGKTLPWKLIEAFDYPTGTVQIKLTHEGLNSFHPSEIADILEEVGTKERLGLVDILDTDVAAQAIEEVDTETQISILEELPSHDFKDIINKLPISEIADIFYKLNPEKIREVLKTLSQEKAMKLQRLLVFPEDEAGGLMVETYFQMNDAQTVGEAMKMFVAYDEKPETIFLVTSDKQFTGSVFTKDILGQKDEKKLVDFVGNEQYAESDMKFDQLLRLFAQYNLRSLPVLDKQKRILGAVSIDTILGELQEEEEEKNETL